MSSTFSSVVKEIISLSREEALRLNSDYIGIEHVLLALIKQGSNSAVSIMNDFHVDLSLYGTGGIAKNGFVAYSSTELMNWKDEGHFH